MKIKGSETKDVVIEITEEERTQLVCDFLCEKFNLQSSHYDGWVCIKEGELVDNWEESAGAHSYFTHKVLRKPTKRDKMVLAILEEIDDPS